MYLLSSVQADLSDIGSLIQKYVQHCGHRDKDKCCLTSECVIIFTVCLSKKSVLEFLTQTPIAQSAGGRCTQSCGHGGIVRCQFCSRFPRTKPSELGGNDVLVMDGSNDGFRGKNVIQTHSETQLCVASLTQLVLAMEQKGGVITTTESTGLLPPERL